VGKRRAQRGPGRGERTHPSAYVPRNAYSSSRPSLVDASRAVRFLVDASRVVRRGRGQLEGSTRMAETATPPHTISRSTNQLCCRFSMSGRGVHSLHLARLELASGWQMRCRCVHSERQALSAAETIHGRALASYCELGLPSRRHRRSGARYSGVPQRVQVLSSTSLAKPKSAIFKWPSASIRRFSGFRSR